MPTKKVTDYKKDHPEREEGEVYIGNFDDDIKDSFGSGKTDYQCVGWKTKRKGVVAYNCDGKQIGKPEGLYPVFIKQNEIKEKNPETLKRLLPSE